MSQAPRRTIATIIVIGASLAVALSAISGASLARGITAPVKKAHPHGVHHPRGSKGHTHRIARHTAHTTTYIWPFFLDRLHGNVVAEANGRFSLLTTANDGKNWKSRRLPFSPTAMRFVTRSNAWAMSAGYPLLTSCRSRLCSQKVFRTDNGGTSWHTVFRLPLQALIIGYRFLTPSRAAVLSRACRPKCAISVWETGNGGKSWHRFLATTSTVIPIGRIGSSFAWGTSASFGVNWSGQSCSTTLYTSHNSARTWSRVLSRQGPLACSSATYFGSPNLGVIGLNSGLVRPAPLGSTCAPPAIFETVDGGHHWTGRHATGGCVITSIDFPKRQSGWVTYLDPTTGAVAATSDGGISWHASLPCFSGLGGTNLAVTGPREAWVTIPQPLSCSSKVLGLEHTTDGGRHWQGLSPHP